MSKFTGLTLFAGIGGSSHAIKQRGGDVVAACDFKQAMVDTLRANGFNGLLRNVKTTDFRTFGHVDVLIGGPPCQPFSQGANNDGQFDERDMIPEFLRAVAETLPAIFIMEEVKTLLWKKHRAYYDHVVECFEALGYVVDFKVLDSSDFGVGQARKRLFTVGRRIDTTDEVLWPEPREQKVTMAAALGWTFSVAEERAAQAPVPGDPSWVFQRPSTTVVGSFRPDVQAAPGYRQAGDGPRQNTPGSVVTTLEERLVLQGIPRTWKVCGTKAERDLQVGNSCPPIVLMSILAVNGF